MVAVSRRIGVGRRITGVRALRHHAVSGAGRGPGGLRKRQDSGQAVCVRGRAVCVRGRAVCKRLCGVRAGGVCNMPDGVRKRSGGVRKRSGGTRKRAGGHA